MRTMLSLGAVLAVTACATVTKGTEDTVVFNSKPPGASVAFKEVSGRINQAGCTTPCTLEINRKFTYSVEMSKEGYETSVQMLEPKLSTDGAAGMAGNVLLGGVIGAAVDASTGAMNDLKPNPMEVTLVPFLIGALEFAMVDTLDPQLLGPWMLLLCAVFVLAIFTSHKTMRRARREPENAYFFDSVGPATWRDFRGSAIILGVLAMFGIVLTITGFNPYLALAALLAAITSLGLQYFQARKYWMHSLVPEGT